MNPILRNILAFIAGWLGGSIVNMGLVQLGHSVLPVEGLDPNDMASMAEIMPTLDAKYFIFPFLAHAFGALVGGFIAAKLAANNHMKFAIGVGGFFLIGGIAVSMMIPAPTWFTALDIVVAYIPMAYIGGKMAIKKK